MTDDMTDLRLAPARPGLSLRHRLPVYWRGRARGSQFLAAQARASGDRAKADELDRQARLFQAKADALEAGSAPGRHA